MCFRYCAGTTPWGHPSEHQDFEPQRHDDGCIEVIGFTMTSLVSAPLYMPRLLQATTDPDRVPLSTIKYKQQKCVFIYLCNFSVKDILILNFQTHLQFEQVSCILLG